MPLAPGSSRSVVSQNIREMVASGHPQRQAVAAALSNARRHPHGAGGLAAAEQPHAPPHLAFGGAPDAWFEHGVIRQGERELFHPGGLIRSAVAGRTDRLPISVAANSYVLPADVVSGIGEGNTLAGAKLLNHSFGMGPYGTPMPRGHAGGRGLPHPPPAYKPPQFHFAQGGKPFEGRAREPVKIVAAGGEFVVPPHVVEQHHLLGGGNMNHGHDVLDALVKRVRAHTVKTLQKLPGPKKD